MGLFEAEEKTYVASTVYSLAGDVADRMNFRSTTILISVLTNSKISLGESLNNAYLRGPGMSQRRFFRWAKNHYGLDMPSAQVSGHKDILTGPVGAELTTQLGLAANQTINVRNAVIDAPDFTYWAEAWVTANHPGTAYSDWTADDNEITQEIKVTIISPASVTYVPYDSTLIWGLADKSRKILFVRYTIITEDIVTGEITESDTAIYTYRIGSGNAALDALNVAKTSPAEFFPALPLWLRNQSVRDQPTKYDKVKTAFKKLTGGDVDAVFDAIEDNPDIDDVDYAFLVQGIPLNTQNDESKAYVYAFFKELMTYQDATFTDFKNWKTARLPQLQAEIEWQRWIYDKGKDEGLAPIRSNITKSYPPVTQLRIHSDNPHQYDVRLRWCYIRETLHVGNGAKEVTGVSNLKRGDYHFRKGPNYNETKLPTQLANRLLNIRGCRLLHQYDQYRYSAIEIMGLEHRNFVYDGKFVTTTSSDALDDADESSFLVPLHYPTLRGMSLAKSTQLATSSSYIVFNSYETVKQKWYQTGIFKILLVLVGVALSAFTAGGSLAAAGGLLGTNLAVGLSLGITSVVTAAIVGAIANAVVAMIVSTLITQSSNALFGEKAGSIIGTIAVFFAFTYASNFAATGSLDMDWSKLFRAENLLNITKSVGDAYTKWLAADTADIMLQIRELAESGADKMDDLQEKAGEILGMTGAQFDPMMLTDVELPLVESSESFLTRTQLSGADIVEISMGLVENFADISLTLPHLT